MKKKHRARVIEFFIDVARECFNIGNFNSLMAIICKFFWFLSLFFRKCTISLKYMKIIAFLLPGGNFIRCYSPGVQILWDIY